MFRSEIVGLQPFNGIRSYLPGGGRRGVGRRIRGLELPGCAALAVPDEEPDVALGRGVAGPGPEAAHRVARGRVVLDERQPDDLAGSALEVVAAGRVRRQRVLRVLQDARGALVARYIKVALLLILDHEARGRALVHEDHLSNPDCKAWLVGRGQGEGVRVKVRSLVNNANVSLSALALISPSSAAAPIRVKDVQAGAELRGATLLISLKNRCRHYVEGLDFSPSSP
jgi:hypothetical protein